MKMALSICTLNVNGITEHNKREKVFKHLLDKHFDIYLLPIIALKRVSVVYVNPSSIRRSTAPYHGIAVQLPIVTMPQMNLLTKKPRPTQTPPGMLRLMPLRTLPILVLPPQP